MTTRLLYPCYIPSPEFFVFCFVFLAFSFCFFVCGFGSLVFCSCFCFVNLCYPKVTTPPYPLHFTNVLSQYMRKNEISVLQWPLSIPLATQTHLPFQDTRILTWWWPPEAETCRLIIKIPYISCNKLFSNSCLVVNLNYYKSVVLDVHTLLFSILTSTTGIIHLNNDHHSLSRGEISSGQ